MAVTKLWSVTERLGQVIDYATNPEKTSANIKREFSPEQYQALADVIAYAKDEEKTEREFYVEGINCNVAIARDQFITVKEQYQKTDGIQAYHGYLSFKETDISPEMAQKIGMEFANEVWGKRFQVVVTTHLNTKHLHCHFVINSISFVDGKHLWGEEKAWFKFRKVADRICEKYGLYYDPNPNRSKQSDYLTMKEKAGMPTRYSVAKEAIDYAIDHSKTLKEFQFALKEMGYAYNLSPSRKYWTVIPKGYDKPIRLKNLGADYTNDRIVERIKENRDRWAEIEPFQRATYKPRQYRMQTRGQKLKKKGGLYNSFILGVSGGGKSFAAKGEIINQVLSSDADIIIIDPEREYSQLVNAMGGEVINISATSDNHINAMDMNKDYGDGANPVILKSEFIMSLCEQLIGGTNLGAKQKSIIDRCTASVYRSYQQNDYQGHIPTLQDFRAELLQQDEPEAKELALAIELFTHGSLNTFAKQTNVDTNNRLICYDILDLGKQLMPIGMLVVLDSILNRITQNRAKGKNTFIFIDEIYLLFQHEYSANFLFTLWKRVRKYGAYASGITQNVDDLLQSHTARTMLANSEFIIMLNQASTDRLELAKLLNISDLQMSYITNVEAGHGLIKVGSSLVPFANKFPKNTKLYKLMTTKPGEA